KLCSIGIKCGEWCGNPGKHSPHHYTNTTAASGGLVRCLFLKLDTNVLVFWLNCALGPPTPLSILVRARLRCSVKGVVHSVVRDLQFLSNLVSPGVMVRFAFIVDGMSVTPRPVLWSGIDLEVEGPSWPGAVCHSIIGLSLLSLQAISTLCVTGKTSSSLMWYPSCRLILT
uniref:Uncharacterized protein n=1 Tax=Oncorhynchus tshawytscha TaxID=74940 RepID=A0AAZ3S4Q2_ONCTS